MKVLLINVPSSNVKYINIFAFFLLIGFCFYLYRGFQTIYYTITQDYIPSYVGTRYVISHPSFMFVIGFPHIIPLFHPYQWIVQKLTDDIQWLNVLVSLSMHVVNAFILFKIGLLLNNNRLFPSLVASLFFLSSVIHLDNLLSFPHSYPVMASFFGLLSLYFFLKIIYLQNEHIGKQLGFSFLFLLLSLSFGENFIGLILFYFFIMAFKVRYFRKKILYAFFCVSFFFVGIFLIQRHLTQLYDINSMPLSISFNWLIQKIRNYDYSFLDLTSLFFHNFPKTLSSLLNDSISYCYNRNVSLFALLVPLVFLKKEKILRLYSLLILMYSLFIPYLFSRVALAARHITSTVVASSLFTGLLFYYTYEAINRIEKIKLRGILHLMLISFVGIFFFKYLMIAREEVEKYIKFQTSFSPHVEAFTNDFKKIKVYNPKRQIYFLKNEIPKEYVLIGNPEMICYNIFYYAIKYKELPIDLYLQVYKELECGVFNPKICVNYFISLPDKSCFGVFRDREKLLGLISENPYISSRDVIILDWQDGLKQER